MRLLDVTLDTPEANLALDEVLLDRAERGAASATLRFWESPVRFVVLGTAQVLAQEVAEAACAADGVPVRRRCSAGGCVLQGPGCLNFTLALRYDAQPEVRGLKASYCFILHRLMDTFAMHAIEVTHLGISDLVHAGRKVSGNAQRRRRNAMLHHGTLLHRADYEGMARYLAEPLDRPAYRGMRGHREFVGALPLDPVRLRGVVRTAFQCDETAEELDAEEAHAAEALARMKYADPAWIRRR